MWLFYFKVNIKKRSEALLHVLVDELWGTTIEIQIQFGIDRETKAMRGPRERIWQTQFRREKVLGAHNPTGSFLSTTNKIMPTYLIGGTH